MAAPTDYEKEHQTYVNQLRDEVHELEAQLRILHQQVRSTEKELIDTQAQYKAASAWAVEYKKMQGGSPNG